MKIYSQAQSRYGEEPGSIVFKKNPRAEGIRMKEVVLTHSDGVETKGFLNLPETVKGLVIFAHGSGSGRFSVRNQQVATYLNKNGFATLLFDLLTEEESEDRSKIFDIPFLAERLKRATEWAGANDFVKGLPIFFFGASTGAGAALWAAADLKSHISAVVSRGGRPDLAMERLEDVTAPTLLIVGGSDGPVISLNESSLRHLSAGYLVVIPKATHLFEEPGALEKVAEHASEWFAKFSGVRQVSKH